MKVCLISCAQRPILRGGVEAQVYGLAKSLMKYCEEVHVMTVPGREVRELAHEFDNLYIHTIRVPKANIASLALCESIFAYGVSRMIKKLGVEVVHFHKPLTCFALLNDIKAIPTIFHVHNWHPIDRPTHRLGPLEKILIYEIGSRIYKIDVRHVDKVIAVSNFIKKGVINTAGVNEEKVTVIPNSVDTNLFWRNEERDNSILFVGRLVPEKGLDYLIRAMPTVLKEIPNAKLIVVGPTDIGIGVTKSLYKSYVRRLVKSLNLRGCVEFLDRIPPEQLRSLYGKVGVYVLSSVIQEAFGITLIEAMACETPVVATRVGGVPEIFRDGIEGSLVDPGNVRQLAEAIITPLADKKMARSMGHKGRKIVERYYSWNANVEKFYKVYRELYGGD